MLTKCYFDKTASCVRSCLRIFSPKQTSLQRSEVGFLPLLIELLQLRFFLLLAIIFLVNKKVREHGNVEVGWSKKHQQTLLCVLPVDLCELRAATNPVMT